MALTRRRLFSAGALAAIAAPGLASRAMNGSGVETDVRRDTSLWTTQAPPLPSFGQLQRSVRVDLAVVGGGYTGLATAYYAKSMRPHWRVVVIDSQQIGSGASSRNSGAVYAKHVGVNNPGFAERGLNRLRHFIDAEEIDCDFLPAPTLTMASSRRAAEKAQKNMDKTDAWIPAEVLKERIGSGYYHGAVESANYFTIQPAKLLHGHVQAALQRGVGIYAHTPALSISPGKQCLIKTPGGVNIVADQVMVATNAYTPRLGFCKYRMFPLHQYTLASEKLLPADIARLGLDKWTLRFEPNTLPVTFSVTPTGHFFVRLVLGYASADSETWHDSTGAKALAQQILAQRYPDMAGINFTHGWHGVTGHTPLFKPIAGVLGSGNIHISAAYNGLGIMPAHNSGYLSACRIVGRKEHDEQILTSASTRMPFPGEYYRSMLLKPFMNLMTPV